MARHFCLQYSYPVDPDRLFANVIDMDTLEQLSRPWFVLDYLPSGPPHAGQIIDIEISFLGILPRQTYQIEIVVCDPATRRIETRESGFGMERFQHVIQVEPDGNGARIVETVEIEAGWRSGLWAWVARMMLTARQRQRSRILAQAEAD